MKAIILAAGIGKRLEKYTKNRPKCMLEFKGKPLIKWQVDSLRACGISDIVIVKGYMPDKINLDEKFYINRDFSTTNMLHSLFVAEQEMTPGFILSYSDIIYESRILDRLIKDKSDICVLVDEKWRTYWKMRYGNDIFDTESLAIDKQGFIKELGRANPENSKIDARYIGLLKFSAKGARILKETYHDLKSRFGGKTWKDKPFEQAYMTDILQEMIDRGIMIKAVEVKNGWLEFDTNEDYEKQVDLDRTGSLRNLFKY